MADLDPIYTLTTPGGTVLFNDPSQSDSGEDELRLTNISGLDGPTIRAPMDDVPYGDGGLSYNFWKGARHIIMEGVFLIRSVRIGSDDVKPIRNTFEEDIRGALESIAALAAATGTLAWQPDGWAARSLTVRHDVQFDTGRDQDNLLETFHFGLVADNPDWT
jgi:hypothetical protein